MEFEYQLSPLNDPAATAKYLDLPVQTLASWRHQKIGIPFVKIGRLVRYKKEDILEYISTNTREVA